MDENPCCPPGSLGFAPLSSHVPTGHIIEIATTPPTRAGIETTPSASMMNCYSTGASLESQPKRVVIIFSDVYGWESGNHKAFADTIAERLGKEKDTTTTVLLPDMFRGYPIMQPWFPQVVPRFGADALGAPAMIKRIKFDHTPEKIEKDLRDLYSWLKDKLPDIDNVCLYCIGFCFGGWVVGRALAFKELPFKAGVGIHPSFKPEVLHLGMGSQIPLAQRIGSTPCLLLPAYNDDLKPDSKEVQIMANARGVAASEVSVPFPSMWHGWVTRGDSSKPDVFEQQSLAMKLTADFITEHA